MRNYTGVRHRGLLAGLLLGICAACASLGAAANSDEPPALRKDAPLEYTVKRGDTMWDIAGHFLKDAYLWPEIWQANPDVPNPHRIYPGDKLYLSYFQGRPRLSKTPPADKVRKLSPRVRVTQTEEAIETIPLDVVRAFLNGPRIVDLDVLNQAPYIVDFDDNRILGSENSLFYAKGVSPSAGEDFQVVVLGKRYKDPVTGKDLGQEVVPSADAVLVREESNTLVALQPEKVWREYRKGDLLLPPFTLPLPSAFLPHPPTQEINARVVSVFGGLHHGGRNQIVTLNRGSRHGLDVGTVLDVKSKPREVPDIRGDKDRGVIQGQAGSCCGLTTKDETVKLPSERVARVMVFATYPNISYALVMESTRNLGIADLVINPSRS